MTKSCLSSISIYPVKSLRGYDIDIGMVERMGLENDRRLMIVDRQGRFVTQREYSSMALIHATLAGNRLTMQAPQMDEISIEISSTGALVKVEIWRSSGVEAIDQGDFVSEWLSHFLKMSVRLVKISPDYKRQVSSEFAIRPDDHVSFADGYPILIISQASLDDLNQRLEIPIPMNRFRPNLVVSGTNPFAEDGWKRIRVGEVELALVKPCARCNVPDIDQDTAISSKEPNFTLSQYRKYEGKIIFGVNVIPITTGRIQTGDPLDILE